MKTKDPKIKLKISVATFFITPLFLIASVILFICAIDEKLFHLDQIYPSDDDFYVWCFLFAILFLAISLALNYTSHKLIKNYKEDEGEVSKPIKAIYILTFVLMSVIYLVLGIIYLGMWIWKKWGDSSSSSYSSSKPKEIKFSDLTEDDYENLVITTFDEIGHEIDLHWDKYTKTWRDIRGWQYVTTDGKNFRLIKK